MKVKAKSLSCVRPSATPWTAAFQAPPSMGFSRQEYWSGVPLPSPNNSTAAKSLQSCPTLCDPRDGRPAGSPVPGILQARTLERGALSSWAPPLHVPDPVPQPWKMMLLPDSPSRLAGTPLPPGLQGWAPLLLGVYLLLVSFPNSWTAAAAAKSFSHVQLCVTP